MPVRYLEPCGIASRSMNMADLFLDGESVPSQVGDSEAVVDSVPSCRDKAQIHSEGVLVGRGKHRPFDPAAGAQGLVQRAVQSVRDQPKGIQEVTLARTVRADQESQLGQLDVATLDAAVRSESDPAYLGRGHCSTPIRAARTNVSKRTPDGAGSTCEAPRGLPSDDGRPLSLEAIRLLGVAVL